MRVTTPAGTRCPEREKHWKRLRGGGEGAGSTHAADCLFFAHAVRHTAPVSPAPPCSPSALLCTPPTCRHASPLYVPFFSLRSWKVQLFLNQHRTHSNAVCASSAVHLRPKTLPGENLGGPGPPAPPETTDGAGEPRTRHGQRTFSFDCLHFPTLSQRCPGPEQRRQDRGLPPSPPSATPGPGRQTFEDSMVHEVLCVTRRFTACCALHRCLSRGVLHDDVSGSRLGAGTPRDLSVSPQRRNATRRLPRSSGLTPFSVVFSAAAQQPCRERRLSDRAPPTGPNAHL